MCRMNTDRVLPEGFVSPYRLAGCQDGSAVLLALSGGSDSASLLDMLVSSGCRVECAHLNHMIRGETALRDEKFCLALGEKYGVPVHVGRIDVPASARERGEGIEEAARRERYAFLAGVMRKRGISVLVTAHNADDNLETLLLRLARGSGARGMCGIPPVREFDGDMTVVRPILGVTKAEILEYCGAYGIEYVSDETNEDIEYSRNRIRARVVPELRRINPAAAESAARLSASLREDCDYLDSLACRFVESSCAGGRAPASELCALPPPISHRVLARLYRDSGGAMLEEKHVRMLINACDAGDTSVSLPGGISAEVRGGLLAFSRVCEPHHEELPEGNFYLSEGENPLPGGCTVIICHDTADNSENTNLIYKVSTKTRLNTDTIKGALYARRRLPGDRILQNGMHKSVKKLFCDKKIPAALRARIPVICCGEEIILVPFIGARDGAEARGDGAGALSVALMLPDD